MGEYSIKAGLDIALYHAKAIAINFTRQEINDGQKLLTSEVDYQNLLLIKFTFKIAEPGFIYSPPPFERQINERRGQPDGETST